jgi:hypothetical protein
MALNQWSVIFIKHSSHDSLMCIKARGTIAYLHLNFPGSDYARSTTVRTGDSHKLMSEPEVRTDLANKCSFN